MVRHTSWLLLTSLLIRMLSYLQVGYELQVGVAARTCARSRLFLHIHFVLHPALPRPFSRIIG